MKTNNLVFIKDRSSPSIVFDSTKEYPLLLREDELFGDDFRVGNCKIVDHTVTDLPSIDYYFRYRHTFVIKIIEFKLDEFTGFIYQVSINTYNDNVMNFILKKDVI